MDAKSSVEQQSVAPLELPPFEQPVSVTSAPLDDKSRRRASTTAEKARVKKDKQEGKDAESQKKTHCFLTHVWGDKEVDSGPFSTHERICSINKALKALGVRTWFDNERAEKQGKSAITKGIDNTESAIVFVTTAYRDKINCDKMADNCQYEFTYVVEQLRPQRITAVVLDFDVLNSRDWKGQLGASLGGNLSSVVNFCSVREGSAEFSSKVRELFERVDAVAGVRESLSPAAAFASMDLDSTITSVDESLSPWPASPPRRRSIGPVIFGSTSPLGRSPTSTSASTSDSARKLAGFSSPPSSSKVRSLRSTPTFSPVSPSSPSKKKISSPGSTSEDSPCKLASYNDAFCSTELTGRLLQTVRFESELRPLLGAWRGNEDVLNWADEQGNTLLHHRCGRSSEYRVLRLLWGTPGFHINKANKAGDTPLHRICEGRDVECVKLILAWPGVDLNRASNRGETALMRACLCGNVDVVRALLDQPEIDMTIKDKFEKTAYNYASSAEIRALLPVGQW